MKPETSGWTLSRLWGALKKYWMVVIGLAVIGGAVGFGVSALTKPVYEATASLYFSMSQATSPSDLNQGSTYTQGQMLSFAQLATSSRVLQPVIDDLGLDTTPARLSRSIVVTNSPSTVILEVKVSAGSPEEAAATANAVADSLTDAVREVSPVREQGAPAISASLIDKAVPPTVQALPNKPRDALFGVLAGAVIGIFVAVVATLLDTRIPTETILRRVVAAPVLGSVSRVRSGAGGLYVVREPLGHTAEEFRRVSSALAYTGVGEQVRRLLITSTSPGEGKSTFASNMAVTLAELGSTVIIVDADLRRPRVAEYFGVEGAVGLTTVLLGTVPLDEAKLPGPTKTLDVLPSGAIPPNPAELLTSAPMRELVDELSRRYDFVIIDSPPVLNVADASLLAPTVDGAIIVVDAGKTRRTQLAHAAERLTASGGRVLGMVLNKARNRHQSYYYEESVGKGKSGLFGRFGERKAGKASEPDKSKSEPDKSKSAPESDA